MYRQSVNTFCYRLATKVKDSCVFVVHVFALRYVQCMNDLYRQQECEHMNVQFFCQPEEAQTWYHNWQKTRLRWWKRVRIISYFPLSFSINHCTSFSSKFFAIFLFLEFLKVFLLWLMVLTTPVQLATNPDNFFLEETPSTELHLSLQESYIKVRICLV